MKSEPILAIITFALGNLLALKCYRVKKKADEIGYNLFADYRTAKEEEVDMGINFGLLLGFSIAMYMISVLFIMISLDVSIDFAYVLSVLSMCVAGRGISIILSYRAKRKYKREVKVKIGFRKEKLPLFFSDLVLAILMIFLFTVINNAIRWIFLFFGIFVLLIGLIGLILKPSKS